MSLLEKRDLPYGFDYPKDFLWVVEQKLNNLCPWVIIFDDELKDKDLGLKSRYKSRILVPFARRVDNDDVACFETNNTTDALIVHDYAKEGWEERQRFNSFWDWFRQAVDDMIAYGY